MAQPANRARPPARASGASAKDSFRVLVTGSRTWSDRAAVWAGLDALLRRHGALVVVHGACEHGADAHARAWVLARQADGHPVDEEAHPARWRSEGRAAGPLRNARMVTAGADVCLTWIDPCSSPDCPRQQIHGSHGAVGCATLARDAGIPVHHLS